jgi:hypothetical protein
MTIDTVGVYWKARRESQDECATRLRKFFIGLSTHFPQLADWYKKGATKEDAMSGSSVNSLDESTLLSLLDSGRNKNEKGGVIAPLGFRISLWNQGKPGFDAILSVKCGLYDENPNLSNCAYISGHCDLSEAGLGTLESQEKILLLFTDVWNADWGAVYDSGGNAIRNRVGNGPFLDKMLWMKNAQSESPFDESVTVKQLENGVLYVR